MKKKSSKISHALHRKIVTFDRFSIKYFLYKFHSEKNAQITKQLQIRLTNLVCVARPPPFPHPNFYLKCPIFFIPQHKHRCPESDTFNVLMYCTFIWPLGITLTLINCVNFLKLTSKFGVLPSCMKCIFLCFLSLHL